MSILDIILTYSLILLIGIVVFGKCLMYFGESSSSPLMKTLAVFLIVDFAVFSGVLILL